MSKQMKSWPEHPRTIDIVEALLPLQRHLLARFAMTPRRAPKAAPYDGYDFGNETRTVIPSAAALLDVPNDGSPLSSLLGRALMSAFLLGVEQGRRIAEKRRGFSVALDALILTAKVPEDQREAAETEILGVLRKHREIAEARRGDFEWLLEMCAREDEIGDIVPGGAVGGGAVVSRRRARFRANAWRKLTEARS